MGRYDYGGRWAPYVSVAERRRRAKRLMNKLRKQGIDVQPVEIEGRTIAHSFWGKGWCDHMDSFGDYSNRLPRGRSYVRNGSVCHLKIREGRVEAIVSGSLFYHVEIQIEALKPARWKALKKQCTGKIGSLVELLEGCLSDEIMRSVTARRTGLFPESGQISFTCDCPDRAGMCKHIAAVIYGIGARLDSRPELLFLLRGVDHGELLSAEAAAESIVGKGSQRARRRKLAKNDLENVFGVELDDEAAGAPAAPKKKRPRSKTKAPSKEGAARTAAKKTPHRAPAQKKKRRAAPFRPTARSIAKLRRRLGLSRTEFARRVRVSATTVANWEKATGPLAPHAKNLAALQRLHEAAPSL